MLAYRQNQRETQAFLENQGISQVQQAKKRLEVASLREET